MTDTIVDSHCHLDFPVFADQQDAVIERAHAGGVATMVSICTRLRNEPQVRAIAEAHPRVFYAVGNHPLNCGEETLATTDDLIKIAEHPKMIGIGETGLDYHYTTDTMTAQKQSFIAHIAAAQQTNLPLIIHARAADADIADILKTEYKNAPFPCVMHCFSSSKELAHTALDLGFYLSMSGIATFKNSQDLRDIFAGSPLDKILVETDSPYLAPVPHRGGTNEPALCVHTAAVGADIFGLTYDDFARTTTDNFYRLFSKAWR